MGIGNDAYGIIDDATAIRSVLCALELGVSFIDTARGYGESEALIGRALKAWRGEAPFVATKVKSRYGKGTQWALPPPVSEVFPKGQVTQSVELSRAALDLDVIDLIQLHLYWPNWGTEGYWMEELQALKAEGKVRHVGISIPDHRHDTALHIIQTGLIDSVQTIINIFDPTALDCLAPICAANRVAVIARVILDMGALTGFLTADMTFHDHRTKFYEAAPREEWLRRVDALRAYIPDHASSLPALAVKFCLKSADVTTAISSMQLEAYVRSNLAAMDEEPLSDAVFDEIRKQHRWVRNFYTNMLW